MTATISTGITPSIIPQMTLGQQMTAALDIMNSQTPYGVANQMQNAQSFADHYGFQFAESEPELFARWMRPSFDRQVTGLATSTGPYERFMAQELETVSFPDLVEAGLVSFNAVDPLYRSLVEDLDNQLSIMIPFAVKRFSALKRWTSRLLIVGAAGFTACKLPSNDWPFWLALGAAALVAAVLPRDLVRDIRFARINKQNSEKRDQIRSTLFVLRQDWKAAAEMVSKISSGKQGGEV